MTLPEKLQYIMDKCNEAQKCSNTERNQHFARELAIFELKKERTDNIFKLHKALKIMPTTSVKTEGAFSAVGLFITKLCRRLNDMSINTLY